MSYVPGNAQHIGRREQQQDAFAFSDVSDRAFLAHGGALAVLADGMGGIAGGREAAPAAVKALLDGYLQKALDETIPAALERALRAANEAVLALAGPDGEPAGTTLVAVALHRGGLHWLSVGDSRAYVRRDGRLSQITVDHSYATELDAMAARDELARESAAADPERESLTSHLGQQPLDAVDRSVSPFPLRGGDLVLLCSDGLYRTLDHASIAGIATAGEPQAICERLVAEAIAREAPHQDNVTAVAIVWHDDGEPPR